MNLPIKPDESDCCGSGCSPCIFDVYEQQLEKYNKYLKGELDCGKQQKNCISLTKYTLFKLVSITKISNDANLYTFQYGDNFSNAQLDVRLHYEAGQHLVLRAEDLGSENKYFTRAYTPIPLDKGIHAFTVLVKLYTDGKMSEYFKQLEVGCETFWRGPYGDYKINFKLKNILMICQGTGIAPIYAVINKLIHEPTCETFIKLFLCCRESVYLHDIIYKMRSFWNFTYEIFLTRSETFKSKKYGEIVHTRRLQQTDIESYLASKQAELQILICGSELFNTEIKNMALKCGAQEQSVFQF